MGTPLGSGPLGSGHTGPGSGFSVMPNFRVPQLLLVYLNYAKCVLVGKQEILYLNFY